MKKNVSNVVKLIALTYIFQFISIILLQISLYNRSKKIMNVNETIKRYGYSFESHIVQTDDGYLLEIHRIPKGVKNNTKKSNRSVLLVSGFTCSSINWVDRGPENSLGFLLADEGLDVWLVNNRGNLWGRRHVTLDPDGDKRQFWDFSLHELGVYDIPAIIDYVLNVTKQKRLFYVGYSQGVTILYPMFDARPEYGDKIIWIASLGGSISLKHIKSRLLDWYLPFHDLAKKLCHFFGIYEILPYGMTGSSLFYLLCSEGYLLQPVCNKLLVMLEGNSTSQLDNIVLQTILKSFPAGTSIKLFDHCLQLKIGLFRQYNFGEEGNLRRYGQKLPPQYNVSKAQVPIGFYSGDNDGLTSLKDTNQLISKLSNVTFHKIVPGFNHFDLMWGRNSTELILKDIVRTIKNYV